jgi:hypothetical protein
MDQPPKFKPKPRTPESTLNFRLPDPGAESLLLPKTGKLIALRELLSKQSVLESSDPGGFNFQAFIGNLDRGGVGEIKSNDWKFDVIMSSGRALFLVCGVGPGALESMFTSLNKSFFEKCTILASDANPPIYLYRITSSDLTALEMLAGNTAENVRKKLSGSKITEMPAPFDLDSFIGQITEVSGFFDVNDNFLIAIGGEDFVYRLYVNPGELRDRGTLVCKFTKDGDSYVLIRSEFIE